VIEPSPPTWGEEHSLNTSQCLYKPAQLLTGSLPLMIVCHTQTQRPTDWYFVAPTDAGALSAFNPAEPGLLTLCNELLPAGRVAVKTLACHRLFRAVADGMTISIQHGFGLS
jgi:hypothetical protein